MDRQQTEKIIHHSPDSALKSIALQLLSDVMRLEHELADPRYLYVGRVPRAALIHRDAVIDDLTQQLKTLKENYARATNS